MIKQLDLLILDNLRYKIDKKTEEFLISLSNPFHDPQYHFLSKRITNIPNFPYYFENKGLNSMTIYTDFVNLNDKIFNNNTQHNKNNIIKIIEKLRPKIIFLRDYSVINQYQLGEIYNLNYKKKIFTSIGFPLPSKSFYKYFDKIYFRNTNVLDRQGSYAKEYKLIFHSFNEKILEKIKIKNLEDRKINLSFCGSVQSNSALHHFRRYHTIIKLLEQKINIDLFLKEDNSFEHYMRFFNYLIYKIFGKKYFISYKTLELIGKLIKNTLNKKYKVFFKIAKDQRLIEDRKFPLYKGPIKFLFPFKTKKPIYAEDYYSVINNSKVSLNIHNDTDHKKFGFNIRNFEITGLKSCLLVENGNQINEVFIKDKDLITYDNNEDLMEKIRFLEKNKKFAEEIALNGHKKTINFHTHKLRSEQFLKDFLNYL